MASIYFVNHLREALEQEPLAPIERCRDRERMADEPGGFMSSAKKVVAVAVENRARQAALGFALSFASFILFTQFLRVFFG
jgi:hypothetical protein